MPKIPFSVYDFFGYLACGFLLCATYDFTFGGQVLLVEKLPTTYAIFWTVMAYIIGHINANLSLWILEKNFVGRFLGKPEKILLNESLNFKWRKIIFPGYYSRINEEICNRISSKAEKLGVEGGPETLFHHVRNYVKHDSTTWMRIEVFLERYGFCRNTSFALFLSALILVISKIFNNNCEHSKYALFAFIGSLGMLYRYLKFYRQYSFEIFTAYPDV